MLEIRVRTNHFLDIDLQVALYEYVCVATIWKKFFKAVFDAYVQYLNYTTYTMSYIQ